MTTLKFPYVRKARTATLPHQPADPERRAGPWNRPWNRFGAAHAVLGGIGALALAVLVIPATPSLASDVIRTAEGPVTTSAAKADAESALGMVIGIRQPPAVHPHRAAKSDRLFRWPQAQKAEPEPEPAAVDLRRNLEPLRGGVHATAAQPVPAPEEPNFAPDFALGADADPQPGLEPEPEPQETGSIEPSIQADAEADTEAEADAAAVTATRSVPVTTDVNMRAGPDNSAPVILVVPGKRHVEVIACDFWCEVVYDGKRGWIYKGFVPGAQS
jgi:hypothetical protein